MAHRLAILLLALSQTALVGIVLTQYPIHLSDPSWPDHAKAHLLSQIAALTGLTCISLIVLFKPFRAGNRWAWYSLALAGFAIYGGYWIALGMAEPGGPWRSAYLTFATLSLVYLIGLTLGWRGCFRSTT